MKKYLKPIIDFKVFEIEDVVLSSVGAGNADEDLIDFDNVADVL